MLTQPDRDYFASKLAQHEASYLAGSTPQKQSGFGRDAEEWKRFRYPTVEPIHKDGSFLDIGCANGLLMESVASWTRERGQEVEVFGLEISTKLAELARRRLPHWHERISEGNAFLWDPPRRFDFVRSELVYVPTSRRREYVTRLLEHFVAPKGRLLLSSYGSTRPEGRRSEPLAEELEAWGLQPARVDVATSAQHGFVVTSVLTIDVP